MHAIAGTIGHTIITDEYARQQAKQASRERVFSSDGIAALGRLGLTADNPHESSPLSDHRTLTGGTSTPSAAASPPHDAEADREAKRLEAAKHLQFLAQVRAWADGDPVEPTIPRARVEALAEDLEHLARQATDSHLSATLHGLGPTASFRMGQANAYRQAALLVRDALR